MFSPSATGHRGIIIGDFRTHLHHLTNSRCSHWRVTWDTRCARLPDNRIFSVDLRGTGHLPITIADFVLRHAPTGIIHGSSASGVGNLVICRPAAQHRILHFPASRQAGIYNPITGHSATGMTTRETLRRPVPHHTGMYALHSTHLSSSCITSTSSAQSQEINIIPIQPQTKSCTETCASVRNQRNTESQEVFSKDAEDHQSSVNMDQTNGTTRPVDKLVDWSVTMDNQDTEEDIMQISGAGHWFMERWICDHAVDFLVDSGSAVTAVSQSFYNTLVVARAPVGDLRPAVRTLRRANGSQININSSCVVSFLGLRTEFPILVCDLSTDAIIGTDTLG